MSLYPSLEDMKVDHMLKAQAQSVPSQQHVESAQEALPYPVQPSLAPALLDKYSSLYPALDEYMGLSLSPEAMAEHMPNAVDLLPPRQVAIPNASSSQMVAPISGSSLGLKRAEITHGIREVTLCKDNNGKIGLRLHSVNKGVFVALVNAGSPAALAGLRFGDQILMINDEVVAGYSMDKVHGLLKKSPPEKITMAVRDRPFERTVTVHKDSTGHVGFAFKNGKIIAIVKDSSAARNGLLTEHHLLEVNGQNVVGLKDSEITRIIEGGGNVITVTIMPSYIHDHVMKSMASGLKKLMDHTIPDV
ncbi:syntenin-1-like [Limulus polyphemus]|uniref:Syntenin-1-like n=1 Tax=Limulus polyphemus TaxID=6850 RepID=A0ABM1B9L6_LIMPO|nr:syntenin-1-like [Limulus polyphemus]XP_022245166.1 syntenin-1-like [Limulus polyphemus]